MTANNLTEEEFYKCDNSIKGKNNLFFDFKKFPNITFQHKKLGGNFTLTYKDLFIDNGVTHLRYCLLVFVAVAEVDLGSSNTPP